jgi:hypothetical protein
LIHSLPFGHAVCLHDYSEQFVLLYWLLHPSVNSCRTLMSADIDFKYSEIMFWQCWVKCLSCCKSKLTTKNCSETITGESGILSSPSSSRIACLCKIVTWILISVFWN